MTLHIAGKKRINWAERTMPVSRSIAERFAKEQPLAGIRIAACLHVTTETANLVRTLKAGGADVHLCASNPLSTQDDVVASLVKDFDIPTHAKHGADRELYYNHLNDCLAHEPQITMDDGADLVSILHKNPPTYDIFGSTEETTTGVIRLKAMEQEGVLRFPVIAVNDSKTKHFFDNRYGTGQSTLDGILRATNYLIAGLTFVVAGYGWCSKGIAMRARGLGAQVVVTEVDPIRALEAHMDGFRVLPMLEAVRVADVVVSATGNRHVVDRDHVAAMKDGCLIANSGHFDVELNLDALKDLADEVVSGIRPLVDEYRIGSKRIYLLGEGRLVNLACAEGHPAAVMDMSFANQALAAEYLVKQHGKLEKRVHTLPDHIDTEIARVKLDTLGIAIDRLTPEQEDYLASWQIGT